MKKGVIMTNRRTARRSEGEWRELMAAYETSGKTQEEYCQAAGVAPTSFQKWRRRLKERGAPQFVELNPGKAVLQAESAKLEIEIAGGITLRIWS